MSDQEAGCVHRKGSVQHAEHRRIRALLLLHFVKVPVDTKEVNKRKGTIGRKEDTRGEMKKAKEKEEKEVESGGRIDGGETVRKNERV